MEPFFIAKMKESYKASLLSCHLVITTFKKILINIIKWGDFLLLAFRFSRYLIHDSFFQLNNRNLFNLALQLFIDISLERLYMIHIFITCLYFSINMHFCFSIHKVEISFIMIILIVIIISNIDLFIQFVEHVVVLSSHTQMALTRIIKPNYPKGSFL